MNQTTPLQFYDMSTVLDFISLRKRPATAACFLFGCFIVLELEKYTAVTCGTAMFGSHENIRLRAVDSMHRTGI